MEQDDLALREEPSPQKTDKSIAVVGRSGAGRNTALNFLEDLHYHRIDNLPFQFLQRLFEDKTGQPFALGFGYTNETDLARLAEALGALQKTSELEVVYLDAADSVLIRRYSETRRRHPVDEGRDRLVQAMQSEKLSMRPLAAIADIVIDTSQLTPHELKSELMRQLGMESGHLSVHLQSFAYKRGLPREADMVLDCRFLRNPHWNEKLRALNGRDALVRDYVREDRHFANFFEQTSSLVNDMIPALRREGRAYFTVAFGCNGGKHRSVTMVELLSDWLTRRHIPVAIRHRELDDE